MASSSTATAGCSSSSGSKRRKEVVRFPAFKTSIQVLFKRWTALKIAIDNGQGRGKGKEISEWMQNCVEDFFYTDDDLDGEEVADYLGKMMNQEMDTVVDDRSLEEIGERLCTYFSMCKDKKEDALLELLNKLDMTEPKQIECLSRSMQASDSDDSESMEEDDD